MNHSKLVLFAVLVAPVFCVVQSYAQVTSESSGASSSREYSSASSKFKVRVGPGFSTVNTDNSANNTVNDNKRRNGIFAAAEFDMPMSTNFSILTGLNYAQKGMSQSGTILGATYNSSLNLDYLQIPLLAKINLPVADSLIIAVNGGGYFGYAIRREATQNITSGIGSGSAEQDVSGSFREIDAGIRFGAGLEFPFSSEMAFLIGADYDLGLVNINKNDSVPETKTRSFLATVGLGVQL